MLLMAAHMRPYKRMRTWTYVRTYVKSARNPRSLLQYCAVKYIKVKKKTKQNKYINKYIGQSVYSTQRYNSSLHLGNRSLRSGKRDV